MDPITHAVIGMAVSKAAGNQIALSDAATIAVVAGSVFPDIDILFQKWGDYVYLKNHRGMTHSIFGLAASALFIAIVLGGFYPGTGLGSLFLWSLLGCSSHTFFDIFNSYGAKLLWPFNNKKFSLSLLVVFDPIFVGVLIGYIYSKGSAQGVLLAAFALYMLYRSIMRWYVRLDLSRKYGEDCEKISILPSMTGLFRWHFILEGKSCNIVGEKNVINSNINIIKKLHKLQDGVVNKVMVSPVGKFFSEFTPLSHVACEKEDGVTRYVFTDLRYYIRNKFLHHAVLEVDDTDSIVKSSFNPYSMKRSVEM